MIVECKKCEALVDAKVLKDYEVFDPQLGPPCKYSFLKCPKCHSPLLVIQENFGEEWDDPYRLYPPQARINAFYPEPIKKAYWEANACFKAKAYTAAAIMCRKTLEGICNEHKIKEENLALSLQEMKNQGIIENRLFEWADMLRISGNEAVHDLSVIVSADDARDIIEFTNALLEYMFTFRDKYTKYRKRQEEKKRKIHLKT
ncbi:MAG: DUF4145 domain-containing protein [Deltaproteobacteria bacterium]|nr:DUF4145 domain-containing protein [Deltaproteobacteria bacterium]